MREIILPRGYEDAEIASGCAYLVEGRIFVDFAAPRVRQALHIVHPIICFAISPAALRPRPNGCSKSKRLPVRSAAAVPDDALHLPDSF